MEDFVREHLKEIVIGAVVLILFFVVSSLRSRGRSSRRIKLKVYCNHCNWGGLVKSDDMACRRCGSRNVTPATMS